MISLRPISPDGATCRRRRRRRHQSVTIALRHLRFLTSGANYIYSWVVNQTAQYERDPDIISSFRGHTAFSADSVLPRVSKVTHDWQQVRVRAYRQRHLTNAQNGRSVKRCAFDSQSLGRRHLRPASRSVALPSRCDPFIQQIRNVASVAQGTYNYHRTKPLVKCFHSSWQIYRAHMCSPLNLVHELHSRCRLGVYKMFVTESVPNLREFQPNGKPSLRQFDVKYVTQTAVQNDVIVSCTFKPS